MPIEAILFDLGRVIVDFDMADCETTLASRSRLGREDFLHLLWDSGWVRRYERGEVSTAQFHDFLVREGGLEMPSEEFRRCWSEVFDLRPILPTSFLAALARTYPMVLVSNTNEAHADYIRRRYDVFDCFTRHILSYQVGCLKPDRRIFEYAIAAAGRRPEALLFIDDREENVEAAARLGMQVHRFESVAGLHGCLETLGIDFETPADAGNAAR